MGCRKFTYQNFSSLKIVYRKKKVSEQKKRIDYYPFGMPMPNRNIQDANGYRYAYQGQEKDPETGKEAFELRLWDGRIGRWLTTDPAKQYDSPYLGMGNNPINGVDPNGAYFIIDDFLVGFFGGLFQNRDNFSDPNKTRLGNAFSNGSRLAGNSAKIWASFGRTDPDKTTAGKILQVVSKFIWELPQSLTGVFAGQTIGYINGVDKVYGFKGATVIQTKFDTTTKLSDGSIVDTWDWGFTIGSIITTDQTASNVIIRHEYGHYLTSRVQGPLFLPLNILSPISVLFGEEFHSKMPWEKWADKKSHRFFNK